MLTVCHGDAEEASATLLNFRGRAQKWRDPEWLPHSKPAEKPNGHESQNEGARTEGARRNFADCMGERT